MQVNQQSNQQVDGNQQHGMYLPQWRINQRIERLLAFENRMFELSSRHLILVLTLSYKEAWREFITPQDIATDRDHFFNNAPSNTLFDGMKCVWKIEEGGSGGGVHMHLVVFYDGQHRAGTYFADRIGKYWDEVITGGRGAHWNSNRKAAEFERAYGNFTGQIDRGDAHKRSLLRQYLVGYIAKDDQRMASLTGPHYRTIGMSRLP